MRLITAYELTMRTEGELSALFLAATKALTLSRPGTAVRRNALGSLENIARARVSLTLKP